MGDKNLAPPCGIYCGTCELLHNKCEGCESVKGKPFWVSQLNVSICPLYDCSVNKKGLEHCGQCDELPCQLFNTFYDPSLSLEEAKKSIKTREEELLKRKKIGTPKWLKLKSTK